MDKRSSRFGHRQRPAGDARFSTKKGHCVRRYGNRLRGKEPRPHANVCAQAFLNHLQAVTARQMWGMRDEVNAGWCRKMFADVNGVVEVVDDPISILAEPAVKASIH